MRVKRAWRFAAAALCDISYDGASDFFLISHPHDKV